ncbi:MAG: DNRLRE domain-containing protein [Nanoarchaeota archaeon]|nr:DNRLRE domain-containing protein [Nanoarchaeota archaeon]
MKIGMLERILNKSMMFAIGSSLAFGLVTGCGKENSPVAPVNQAPEIYITEGPSNGEEINDNNIVFDWLGFDQDGTISMYKYQLTPLMNNYQETVSTNHTFTDLSNGFYTFSVLARDNEGEWSPEPTERNFSIYKENILILKPGPEDGIDAPVGGIWEYGEPTQWCNENYGDDEGLWVGYFNDGEGWIDKTRSYICFGGLSQIPNNSKILDAKIWLTTQYVDYSNTLIEIRNVKTNVNNIWYEDIINWNNQPECDNLNSTKIISEEGERYWIDVSNLIQNCVDGDYNNGLMIKLSSEGGDSRYCGFYSSDWENSEERPELELVYIIEQ